MGQANMTEQHAQVDTQSWHEICSRRTLSSPVHAPAFTLCVVWVYCGDEKMCHGAYQECWLKHLVRFDSAAAAAAAVAVAAAAANVKSLPFMSAAPTPAAKLTASKLRVSGPVQPCTHSNATCSRAVTHHVPCSYVP